jgi:DNA-binding NarL/FixJ family response regulator
MGTPGGQPPHGHVIDELLDTIRVVHEGKKRIPPDIAAELADHATDDALTEREIDFLRKRF